MVNLVSVLRSQVKEQDRRIALKDCMSGWDGKTDAECILQGVHSRLKAVGRASKGLRLERDLLTRVRLLDVDGTAPLVFSVYSKRHLLADGGHWFPYGDQWLFVTGFRVDHFHAAELEKAGIWLIENFYH
jgi:hypothetical protein